VSISELTRSAQAYWDAAATTYDQDFTETLVGGIQRVAVWRELDRVFRAGQRILELNCGTGIDAVHLAKRGIQVVACDISPEMIKRARQRASDAAVSDRLDFRVLATEELDSLETEAPFDGVFSNFSGLNCVANLPAVAEALERLLKPGASALLCMLGRFVAWEFLWFVAHGDLRNAVRRLRANRYYHDEVHQVWHLSVSQLTHVFAPQLRLRKWKGIGIAVPPSYMEHWAQRFPTLTRNLAQVDRALGSAPLFRNMADFVLLEFEESTTNLCRR
jgi:ubiquinone/menaquinone biosynthesis C-methylase UbiE